MIKKWGGQNIVCPPGVKKWGGRGGVPLVPHQITPMPGPSNEEDKAGSPGSIQCNSGHAMKCTQTLLPRKPKSSTTKATHWQHESHTLALYYKNCRTLKVLLKSRFHAVQMYPLRQKGFTPRRDPSASINKK